MLALDGGLVPLLTQTRHARRAFRGTWAIAQTDGPRQAQKAGLEFDRTRVDRGFAKYEVLTPAIVPRSDAATPTATS